MLSLPSAVSIFVVFSETSLVFSKEPVTVRETLKDLSLSWVTIGPDSDGRAIAARAAYSQMMNAKFSLIIIVESCCPEWSPHE